MQAKASKTKLPQEKQSQNHRMLIWGPTLWLVDFLLLDSLNSVSCKWAFLTWPLAGLTAVQWLEVAISLVALALMAWMTYVPWRNWRELQHRKPVDNPHALSDTESDRGAFLAFLAMGLNVFFLLFVIGTLVPMLALKACGQA